MTTEIRGQLLDDKEVAAIERAEGEKRKAILDKVGPLAGRETIDSFAKYLITASAVVGTVGAGFKVSGAAEIKGLGSELFGLAVVLTGIALALAVLALRPLKRQLDLRASADDLEGAVNDTNLRKIAWVTSSAVLLGLAIVLAGCAPLASNLQPVIFRTEESLGTEWNGVVSYRVLPTGRIRAVATTTDAKPGSVVALRFRPDPPRAVAAAPQAEKRANEFGESRLTLATRRTRRLLGGTLVASWQDENGDDTEARVDVKLRAEKGPRRPPRKAPG